MAIRMLARPWAVLWGRTLQNQPCCPPALAPGSMGTCIVEKGRDGFTLVEVLIATVILMLVVFVATLSFSTFITAWNKRDKLNVAALDDYQKRVLLRYAIESAYDYYVTDPANEKIGHHYPYFRADAHSMTFVTLSAVFQKGKPAACRLSFQENDSGLLDMVYEEASLEKTYIKYYDQEIAYKRMIIPYRNMEKAIIRFYGVWEVRLDANNAFETIYKWQDTFDGKDKAVIPKTIEMTLHSGNKQRKLLFPIRIKNGLKYDYFNPPM